MKQTLSKLATTTAAPAFSAAHPTHPDPHPAHPGIAAAAFKELLIKIFASCPQNQPEQAIKSARLRPIK